MARALLVIDVQREYFDGALPITHPAGHLETILSVMDAASSARVPTAVIRHHQADPESPIFRLHSEMWQLHPEVARRPHDVLIDKQLPGSFTNTRLGEWLESLNADTVTIAGYMTHMCCDTTARQAFHRGLRVEFLRDATGTLDLDNAGGRIKAAELQTAILASQQVFLSEVVSSEDWVNRIRHWHDSLDRSTWSPGGAREGRAQVEFVSSDAPKVRLRSCQVGRLPASITSEQAVGIATGWCRATPGLAGR
jgi:nicotinamidase-related amidase